MWYVRVLGVVGCGAERAILGYSLKRWYDAVIRTWRVTAVIVAAGAGRRMGGDLPKQYLPLCGAPILAWTVAAFERSSVVDGTILVVPGRDLAYVAESIVEAFRIRKVQRIVAGGTARQESVVAGLAAISDEDGVALVHDGVRPFVSERLIAETAACAADHGSAVVAVRISDTIKRVDDHGQVVETVSRERLWAAQTPQGFRLPILRQAVERARCDGFTATDEAMLVERLGIPVRIVPGEPDNIKITTPEDLRTAEWMGAGRERPC